MAWTTHKTTHKIPETLAMIISNLICLKLWKQKIKTSILECRVLNNIEIQWVALLYISK